MVLVDKKKLVELTKSGREVIRMKISFLNIHYSSQFILSADVIRNDNEKDYLYFELPSNTELDDELIALALSTLCGQKYQEVFMDLNICYDCKSVIEKFCRATVHFKEEVSKHIKRPVGKCQALSFSGGFDSLAAKSLLPSDTVLISLDFGGKFAREKEFFRNFDPNTITTNLVDLGLNKNHWSFMAVGMILLRDKCNIQSATFGSIMASSIPNIINRKVIGSVRLPQFSYLNIETYNPLEGVTEIGALSIALSSNRGEIINSLNSLANPAEGKFFRKSLALSVFCKSQSISNINVSIPEPRGWYRWGESYANDLSTLYVIKELGMIPVELSYTDGIPDIIVKKISDLSLKFFLKYNPEAYGGFSTSQASKTFMNLARFNLLPYAREDYMELEVVNSLLGKKEGN